MSIITTLSRREFLYDLVIFPGALLVSRNGEATASLEDKRLAYDFNRLYPTQDELATFYNHDTLDVLFVGVNGQPESQIPSAALFEKWNKRIEAVGKFIQDFKKGEHSDTNMHVLTMTNGVDPQRPGCVFDFYLIKSSPDRGIEILWGNDGNGNFGDRPIEFDFADQVYTKSLVPILGGTNNVQLRYVNRGADIIAVHYIGGNPTTFSHPRLNWKWYPVAATSKL